MRGASYNKVHEFYDSPSRSYGALQTLGAGSILKGLVFPALNKLLNIKADLVKTDEGWEELFTQKGVGRNIPLGLHSASLGAKTLTGGVVTHTQCMTLWRSVICSFQNIAHVSIMRDKDTEKINVMEEVVTSARQGITPACVKTSRKMKIETIEKC